MLCRVGFYKKYLLLEITNLICTKKTCLAASLFVCKSFSIINEKQVAVNCYSAAAQLFCCI